MTINRRTFLSGSLYTALLPTISKGYQGAAEPGSTARFHVENDGSIRIASEGKTAIFRPRFTVLISQDDPELHMVLDAETNFQVPSWRLSRSGGRTPDLFQAAEIVSVEAERAEIAGHSVRWIFSSDPRFRIEANVELPSGPSDPVIRFQLVALAPAWYSIGYTGSPEVDPSEISWLWQPLVWQERRFPAHPFLSMEHMCSLPATFVRSGAGTIGVVIDPSEAPFRLPTFDNAGFGVVLRNAAGKAQPMGFAPVFGKPESKMNTGGSAALRLRIFLRDEEWFETFRHTARDIYNFSDYRSNGPASLNTTIDNMTDLVMNDTYCGWIPDLKGFDYTTDVTGTVKVVSALHPLSLAIIRDSPEIYRRRALPMLEYMMSRQKYLYSDAASITGQNASHLMKGPCAEVSELAALYSMSLDRSAVLSHYAQVLSRQPRRLNLEMVSEPGSFQDLLAMYRMTGNVKYLDEARAAAEKYISQRIDQAQQDFSDVHVAAGGQFWTDFAPKWIDLLELYEATQDQRFLKAAEAGARLYAEYVWLQPQVPQHEVIVNRGSETSMTARNPSHIPDRKPIRAPEQNVPAWRVSQIGLTPEASTTYQGNPAVFLTHYAPYMLRLSYYTGDSIFRDIARAAIVGRYENYPGYTIRNEYTTTYQRPDFPLRPWEQLTYNNIYYNHILPHIAVLMDYLISETLTRSNGNVVFPSRYAQGYAYLQSKVYGDRPGTVYGDSGVILYMPRELASIEHPEVNYVAGYRKDTLYLILMNQCDAELSTEIRLNPNVTPVDADRRYRIRMWNNNVAGQGGQMTRGRMTAVLSPKGITVLAIDGLAVVPQFQDQYFDAGTPRLSDRSYGFFESPFGQINAMLLSMGKSLETAYIWLEATDQEITGATLIYKDEDNWVREVDGRYPYEFSLPFREEDTSFQFYVEAVKPDGSVVPLGTGGATSINGWATLVRLEYETSSILNGAQKWSTDEPQKVRTASGHDFGRRLGGPCRDTGEPCGQPAAGVTVVWLRSAGNDRGD
jgi:hypothetical protein